MKIYCSNRENRNEISKLLSEKDAWEKRFDERNNLFNEQKDNFYAATCAWRDAVIHKIESEIGKLPDFVSISVGSQYLTHELYVQFSCRRVPTWRYRVSIRYDQYEETCAWDNGNNRAEMVEPAEILNRLNQSIEFLNKVADIEWIRLLSDEIENVPIQSQYITIKDPMHDPEYENPGYLHQIIEREVCNLIGKDIWALSSPSYNYTKDVWIRILNEDDKHVCEFNAISENDLPRDLRDIVGLLQQNKLPEGSIAFDDLLITYNIKYPLQLLTTEELVDRLNQKLGD